MSNIYDYAGESKKWGEKERRLYKKIVTSTRSGIGLRSQSIAIKAQIKKRYNAINTVEDLESYMRWLDKQQNLTQRSINGNAITDKGPLYGILKDINKYRSMAKSKGIRMGKVSESFTSFCDKMMIATEGRKETSEAEYTHIKKKI